MTDEIRLGGFHELPDGSIARSCGWNGAVSYYFDDGVGQRTATEAEFRTWTPRPDLLDFPNARDPLLPYHYDLLWDIKRLSELKSAIDCGHEDLDEILALVEEDGIDIGSERRRTASSPGM